MIKRYNDFLKDKLNESKNNLVCPHCGEEINLGESTFLEKFNNLISLLNDEYYSFSRIVSSNRIIIELSPFIEQSGLTWEEITKNKSLIFDNIDKYCNINGGVDYLLYLLNDKYILGGFTDNLKNDIPELSVKYHYGYHLNNYGRKYLLQCFKSIEDYYDCILQNLIFMLDNFDYFDEENNFSNYFHSLPNNETIDIMKKIDGDWYLNVNKFYDIYLGHIKKTVDSKRGEDHQHKVFNILYNIVSSFFKRDESVEVENIDDTLIKISFT